MINELDCIGCLIRSHTCFADLDTADLGLMNVSKVTNMYKRGQIIFYEGMMPTGIFCLNRGKIKISKRGIDGKEQIVRFVVEGGLLGIRALLGGRKYSASATTLEDSIVCFISKETFFRIAEKNPKITECMIMLLSELLEEAEKKMTSMAQKPVRERLAESLLLLNNLFHTDSGPCLLNEDATITLTREDLANIVGTATETVIRLLSEFREKGYVSVEGRDITILDIEGLKKTGKVTL